MRHNFFTEDLAVARSKLNIHLDGGGSGNSGDLALLLAALLEALGIKRLFLPSALGTTNSSLDQPQVRASAKK